MNVSSFPKNLLRLFIFFFPFFIKINMMAQPFIIAHRGASGTSPENTLAAFKKAIDSGADFIELDVHLSKDGKLIVMHDETVNRTTNGKGLIRELSLDQIKKLDAGSWFNISYAGLTVPTLDEVVRLITDKKQNNSKIKLLIEVKGSSKKYPGIEKILIEKINEFQCKDQCVVQSFDKQIIKNIAQLDSSITLHQLIVGKIFPRRIPDFVQAINPNHYFVSKRKIEKLHSLNKKIFVWTVNKEKKMEKLISLGVDGIITNYPEKLKSIIQTNIKAAPVKGAKSKTKTKT